MNCIKVEDKLPPDGQLVLAWDGYAFETVKYIDYNRAKWSEAYSGDLLGILTPTHWCEITPPDDELHID